VIVVVNPMFLTKDPSNKLLPSFLRPRILNLATDSGVSLIPLLLKKFLSKGISS